MLQPPISKTGMVTATGTAEIDFPSPTGPVPRTVSQVSIAAPDIAGATTPTAPGNATAGVYFNGFLVTPMVAQADAASGDPPVVVTPNDVLSVQWTNCTPGRLVNATFIYDDGR